MTTTSTPLTLADIQRLGPNHPDVFRRMKEELLQKQIPALYDRAYFLGQQAVGKSALDIGIVEHTSEYWDAPGWLHKYIHNNARECLGVDINQEGIQKLCERGYHAVVADVTSNIDLGKKFDMIVAGELVEHISRLDEFFHFCLRHSHEGTRLYLTTPNPHYIGYMVDSLKKGTHLSNAEHVNWISPTHILELCRRTGWELDSYTVIVGSQNQIYQKYFIPLTLKLYKKRYLPEWIGYTYMYILKRPLP
jgi:2-polyprenyl-3-methyl-5-hydroxy-6-metoxy-1,4-benzoquinol methylase